MRFFSNRLSLNNRVLLWIITGGTIIITLAGVLIFQIQRNQITHQLNELMETQLNDFSLTFDQISKTKKNQLHTTSHYFIEEKNAFMLIDSMFIPFDKQTVFSDLSEQLTIRENEFVEFFTNYFNNTIFDANLYNPILIFKSGKMHVHHTGKQRFISETQLFRRIRTISDTEVLQVRYIWPEDDDAAETHYMFLKYIPEFTAFVAISAKEKQLFQAVFHTRNILFILFLSTLFLLILASNYTLRNLLSSLEEITKMVQTLAKGKKATNLELSEENELGDIVLSLNELADGLKKTSQFSKELGSGNFDTEYTPLSEEDELGNSLINMKKSLQEAEIERSKQKAIEEDRNWGAYGQAKFADILRQNNDNLNDLSYKIISELVKYLDAIQGGIFIFNKEEEDNPFLELAGCFAFDRRKYLKRKIIPGEGLAGTCFLERETIYMTDIPEGYMDIASGMGNTEAKSILIVPLKLNEETYGVVEIASLSTFESYKINFVEKIAEVIASTLSAVHNNMRTRSLLEQFQRQSEEMKEQEEELQQNMEELEATQEEAARREKELNATLTAVNNTIGTIELDAEGHIIDANVRYLAMTEIISLQKIQHMKLVHFEKKQNKSNYCLQKELWEHLKEGKTFSGTFCYIFENKEKVFYESYTPIHDENNKLTKVIGLVLYETSHV